MRFSDFVAFCYRAKTYLKNGTVKQLSINNQNLHRQALKSHSNKIGFIGNREQQNQKTVINRDFLRINNLQVVCSGFLRVGDEATILESGLNLISNKLALKEYFVFFNFKKFF